MLFQNTQSLHEASKTNNTSDPWSDSAWAHAESPNWTVMMAVSCCQNVPSATHSVLNARDSCVASPGRRWWTFPRVQGPWALLSQGQRNAIANDTFYDAAMLNAEQRYSACWAPYIGHRSAWPTEAGACVWRTRPGFEIGCDRSR